ncbi:ShlB/FhaC/HecB family hemolysin secretion/activation protein [Chelatococcus sp. SYSU_G07232]|uniref:ShlB/FhaC/HecB family hemolysin secretion/activation protein n=1 Tax=Chelatococcus albus TaxID=3047466 RepID=A0ABT7ACD6_9HYPH|nr:ShlB/FhaC/HecB family hemolysin secretion/activation protein [Chelatococcus sp. SYSU_G07232]MDJ1157024.1 ShlB/FhaC/HecB family hemolysin secretion/activation protein [Chelatococcus sp. SYSU_G07232]
MAQLDCPPALGRLHATEPRGAPVCTPRNKCGAGRFIALPFPALPPNCPRHRLGAGRQPWEMRLGGGATAPSWKAACPLSGPAFFRRDVFVQRRSGFLCVLLSGIALPALAQDAGSLLRERQRQQELQRLERPPEPEADRPLPAPSSPLERGATIVVREVRFTGKVGLLEEAVRARIAASAKGKRLGLQGLQALADEVTAALQKKGRLLARGMLPPQDVTEGVVIIAIVEGALERIEFERGANVRTREGLLRDIGDGQIRVHDVTKADLESALLRMNDLPGVTAKARLTPGSVPNTSRLVIGVEQAPIFSATLWGDNSGSASTGRAAGNAQASLTDITGHGDLTRLSGTISEGQQFGQAAFSLPLGATGFAVSAQYGYLAYRNIDNVGRSLDLEGYAHFAGFGLDYSLIRSRDFNVRLSGGLTRKALVDNSLAGRLQDKRSLAGTLGINGDMRDSLLGGGLTSWSLAWTFGDLDLSRVPAALAVDQAGLGTQGAFQRVNASLSRLQDLPGDFSLFGLLYGQWANKNLDSSEDFALGGPYGLRGWPVGEGRGDMGVLGTLELRYDAPVPTVWGALQFALFLDAGQVWVNESRNGVALTTACGCNAYSLASAGLSARWTREAFSLAVTWAHGLTDNPGRSSLTGANADGGRGRDQFWLRGALKF